MISGPDANLPRLSAQDEHLLRTLLEREQRHLDQFRLGGSSWYLRYRQRGRVSRARKALAWAERRLVGQDAFVLRRGLLEHGLGVGVVTALLAFIAGGFSDAQRAVDSAIIAAVGGAIGGLLGAIRTWDRAEAAFARALTDARAQANGVSGSDVAA